MDDVLIVGAGPVGLMLACELSLAGIRPIVLEKRAEPSELPKANGLGGQIIELLDHRGLLERFSEGSPFAGRAPGFPFGSVPLRFDGLDDIPLRLVLIQQPRMERLLAERAVELGVEIRRGCEVLSLDQDADGVTLGLANGTADGTADGTPDGTPDGTAEDNVRARYVVGCDGGHSLVRELAGIGFPGTTADYVLRLGHFKLDGVADPFKPLELAGLEPGWNRTPHGRVLLTSLQHDVLIAGVREKGDGARPQEGPVTLEDFRAAVRRVLGRDLPLGEPIWLSSTVVQARVAERYQAGRVFLAGDAAHLFPAGGSALNVGMTDAANLGWKLAATLHGRAPAGLLGTYEAERRPAAERTLVQTRAQAALDRLDDEDGAALRELLGEVFAYEQPARHLATLLHGSDVRYGSDPHPLVGHFVPDLALADGRRVAELMRQGRPVLLDLGGGADLDDRDRSWIDVIRTRADDAPADTLLIRPDGYVAWAGTPGLPEAISAWFTPSPA
ncbi:FAD-dependent oxidoreductase [Nonomuraea turkmeniaca]|uniref:FAD-dependent oxidoreductase n=1 Tax=Nonomuraea turkmeniaca TaxID=103838 RepID=A0A5S4EWG1_9ACTN|nr:FAD-dependent monooxygenase [Nonomuraea turkmeniaca]TMR07862.1 FAD-dependent oxidoreductase [Nonomuraea turkmeniaca]